MITIRIISCQMPLFWTYLLRRFFQIFFLSVVTFISILLLMRLQEIVRFATMTSDPQKVALFTLYQIPYILPLALPISGLIASFTLMQSLSRSSEITAFRASGLSLNTIQAPLFFCGGFLALGALLINSELTPGCRLRSKELIYHTTISNPLLLVQKAKLMRLKDSTVEMEGMDRDKRAHGLLFTFRDVNSDRLSLISAKKLKSKGDVLTGSDVAIVTTLPSKEEEQYDELIIENQQKITASSDALTELISADNETPHSEFLPFKWMLIKTELEKERPAKTLRRTRVEIARRFSLALASFTFIVIGATFGIEIGRSKKRLNLIFALLCAAFFLISFSSAKSFHKSALKASLCYLLPHPLVLGACSLYLGRKNCGQE